MMGYEDDEFMYAMGGGININPANKGKFTEWAASRGMGVQEAANKVMANKEKYPTNVVQMANFAKNAAKWKKQDGGEIDALDTLYNRMPVQTESYQGQPEQVVLPDGTIQSVNATQSHESMSDNEITDVLPTGSHIQSSRNKYTPAQYQQLIDMFTPEVAKERMIQIEKITKGKNKKISPAEISEYAKNKYQKQSTPNSFNTDKLKESNKQSFVDLSMQMNDLIKAGKELAEGQMFEEQMMAYGGYIPKAQDGITLYPGGRTKTPTGKENRFSRDKNYLQQWEGIIPGISKKSNTAAQELIYDYTLKNNPEEIKNMWSSYGLTSKGMKDPGFKTKYPTGTIDSSTLTPEELMALRSAYADSFFGARQLEPKRKITSVTTTATPQTAAEKAANLELARINAVAGARQMPMQNRFNYGLLEGQLGRGLAANEAYTNAAMDLDPLYIMETPDTYIRSRKNEIPIGNILYNIERAQRNSANALAAQTGDWSTLASNIANAGATAMNQVGDTLSALNAQNVGLYNTTQGLQQNLLGENIDVRNQNLTAAQNLANLKRNLLGKKAVTDAELYSQYVKSMGENTQKEQNQKLALLDIMAAKPDMFRGEQGQRFANQIMGTTGSFNNPFAGSPLDFLFNNISR